MIAILEILAVFFVIFLALYAIGSHIQNVRSELIKAVDERFCKLEEDIREMREVFIKEEE